MDFSLFRPVLLRTVNVVLLACGLSSAANAADYVVKSGDTISEIAVELADQTGESSAAVQQRLIDENPAAFIGGNPNKLKLGAVLVYGQAAEAQPQKNALVKNRPSHANAQQTILQMLSRARPDLNFSKVSRSESPDLYEVEFNGANTIYATADGRFVVVGELYEVKDREMVNLTEQRRSGQRAELIANIPSADMISFAPESEEKAEIYVFTDVDCGYCRKLHNEIDQITSLGIRVNYLAYPRAGKQSDVAQKMQNAWCAVNPQAALTSLKNGSDIKEVSCPSNAVATQFDLGQEMGVTGTPTLFLADGTKLVGYRPAEELARILLQ
jgi:thiol:disulfide interchange protein DsbC